MRARGATITHVPLRVGKPGPGRSGRMHVELRQRKRRPGKRARGVSARESKSVCPVVTAKNRLCTAKRSIWTHMVSSQTVHRRFHRGRAPQKLAETVLVYLETYMYTSKCNMCIELQTCMFCFFALTGLTLVGCTRCIPRGWEPLVYSLKILVGIDGQSEAPH